MTLSRSYDPRRTNLTLSAELTRLRAQVELAWHKEETILKRMGLQDGMSILELGCGPGFVLQRLRDAFPEATLAGVDHDQELLQEAERLLSSIEGPACELVHADVARTGLPSRHFDFVIMRFCLQHLRTPAPALQEALRVLKRGGRLAIIDVDDAISSVVEPRVPELEAASRLMAQVQHEAGGNRRIGRWLLRLLNQLGFTQLQLEMIVLHSDELGLNAFRHQLDPDRLVPLVRAAKLSNDQLQRVRNATEQLRSTPDALIMTCHLVASGQRPGDAAEE